MNDTVHIVMPTCSPSEFFSKFFQHLYVFDLVKDTFTFGIIFQKPYTDEEINKIKEEFEKRKLNLLYEYREYEGTMHLTPLIKMRDDAAMLNPNADYFLNVDDDIVYTCSAELFKDVIEKSIEHMEKNNVGALMLGYPSHVNPYEEPGNDGQFHPRDRSTWTTTGLLLKNIYGGHIVPVDATKCVGGHDDVLMGECRKYLNGMNCGYYGVAIGHHTDIKEKKDRSMKRLKFQEHENDEGTCRRYIKMLRKKYDKK